MKLAVIGSGKIGKSIGVWAAQLGYEVIFSSREKKHAEEASALADKKSGSANIMDAVDKSDMVLLAVPYGAVQNILHDLGSKLNGKVIIDVTNPLTPDYSGLSVGFTSSAAEEIQKLVPGAKVVKAFNTAFAEVYATQNPVIRGYKISIFVAADDNDAKSMVSDLITRMGFDAIDAGPLKIARTLEPLAFLNINLGYNQGLGTSIGFAVLR
jgi:NADPH-dependent F420 reductase